MSDIIDITDGTKSGAGGLIRESFYARRPRTGMVGNTLTHPSDDITNMGSNDMVHETMNCVRCGKPAKIWSGHVDYFKYTGNKMRRVSVIAGWCSNRCFNDRGFRGMYSAHMGDRRGKQPSPCRITTSPKRVNMIYIMISKLFRGGK